MSKIIHIQIPKEAKGQRIDLYLARLQPELDLSRSRVQDLIRQGMIQADGRAVKAHHKLAGCENVQISIPEVKPLAVLPAAIPIRVLYEDADLIVLDKPPGLVVHPAPGNLENTLVNALLHHCKDLSGIGGVERPGIVQRLDKDTSGVMMAAKNDLTHRSLAAQIKDRKIKKIYWALVQGVMKQDSGVIEAPIGRHDRHRKKMTVRSTRGREATTAYQVLERYHGYTLVELDLKTGRTHQIRVHLSHIHHPVIGDSVYGGRHYGKVRCNDRARAVNRPMLHSRVLSFTHPRTNETVAFEAEIPSDMKEMMEFLGTGE